MVKGWIGLVLCRGVQGRAGACRGVLGGGTGWGHEKQKGQVGGAAPRA